MNNVFYIGWDIGGAHLKAACVNEVGEIVWVEQIATPLWKGLDSLHDAMLLLLDKLPHGSVFHSITMTAELVDVFEDRDSGLRTLIDLCKEILGSDIGFYAAQAGIVNLEESQHNLNQLASANWHATTTYLATLFESGLFIDIGSTTTDIIPFSKNRLNNRGFNDQERLRFDELVYTGVIRTSLMSLTKKIPFAGEWQNIATEHFANTADVYRILGQLNEDDDLMDTADGKPKDVRSSINRLARMLGTDANNFNGEDCWNTLAQYFEESQLQLLTNAVLRILTNPHDKEVTIVGAGVGRFLVKKIAERLGIRYLEFSEVSHTDSAWSYKSNTCAPAVALAQLNRLSVKR